MNRRKCSINNHVAGAPVAPIHEIAWLHSMKSAKFEAVVHEIYRQVQVRYSGGQSDRDLQVATALTLTGNYNDLRTAGFFKEIIDKAEHAKSSDMRAELCQTKFPTCPKHRSSIELSKNINRFCESASDDDLREVLTSATNTVIELMSYEGYKLLEQSPQSEKNQCSLAAVKAQGLRLALENYQLHIVVDEANKGNAHILNAIMGLGNVTWNSMIQAAKTVPFALGPIEARFRAYFESDLKSGLLSPL